MSATRRVNWVASAVLLVSMAGAVTTLHAIDRIRQGATLQEALYIRSSTALRRMSLGYTGLLADIYWTRAVQYFGFQHHNDSQDFICRAPMIAAIICTPMTRAMPPWPRGWTWISC